MHMGKGHAWLLWLLAWLHGNLEKMLTAKLGWLHGFCCFSWSFLAAWSSFCTASLQEEQGREQQGMEGNAAALAALAWCMCGMKWRRTRSMCKLSFPSDIRKHLS